MLLTLLICLALTVIAEGLVILLLFRSLRFVYYSLLANLLTNPALNALLVILTTLLGSSAYLPALIALELAAVAAETLVYRTLCDFRPLKALGVSALLNAVSLGLGLALSGVIPGL